MPNVNPNLSKNSDDEEEVEPWLVCAHPNARRGNKAIDRARERMAQERIGCYLCRASNGKSAAVSLSNVLKLFRSWEERRAQGAAPYDVCKELALYYQKCIEEPANANRLPGEEEVPPLSAGDLLFHFRHTYHLGTGLADTIMELTDMERVLWRTAYECQPSDPSNVRVRPSVLKDLATVVKLKRETLQLDPTKLVGYNPSDPVQQTLLLHPSASVLYDISRAQRTDAPLF